VTRSNLYAALKTAILPGRRIGLEAGCEGSGVPKGFGGTSIKVFHDVLSLRAAPLGSFPTPWLDLAM
jgi:hypothetical protein